MKPNSHATFCQCPIEQARVDKLIHAAYHSPNRGRGSLKKLQYQLGCTHHAVYKRALQIGAIPEEIKKQPDWTAEENEILEDQAHNNPINIRKLLKSRGYPVRTPTAIKVQMHKLGIGMLESRIGAGIYSAISAAKVLGVANHTVIRYIERGMLKAQRETDRNDGAYRITNRALRNLLTDYTPEINFAKIDKFWLAEMLKGELAQRQTEAK